MSGLPSSPSAPESLQPTPRPPAPLPDFPGGARLAGFALLANVVSVCLGFALADANDGVLSPATQVMPLLVDAVVAGGLLQRKKGYIAFAIFRTVAGVVIWGGMMAGGGRWTQTAFQTLYAGSLLLLLVGHASPVRQRVAVSLLAAFFLFTVSGTLVTVAGFNPLGTLLARVEGSVVPLPEGGKMLGKDGAWELTVPQDWYAREKAAAARDNPLAECWLMRPDADAHVLVVSETLEAGKSISPSLLRKTVLDRAAQDAKDFRIISEEPLHGGVHVTLVKTTALGRFRYDYLILAWENHAVQVIAFASEKSYARVAADVDVMFGSFRPMVDSLSWPERGHLAGDRFAYSVTLPNEQWLLLGDTLALSRKDTVDRWLVRPDQDARVLIIAEKLEDATNLELRDFSKAVVSNVVDRVGPLRGTVTHSPLPHGDLLRFHISSGGGELVYVIGAWVFDDLAVQVMGFSMSANEEQVAPDLEKIARSLEHAVP